jgi:hypothetical protein
LSRLPSPIGVVPGGGRRYRGRPVELVAKSVDVRHRYLAWIIIFLMLERGGRRAVRERRVHLGRALRDRIHAFARLSFGNLAIFLPRSQFFIYFFKRIKKKLCHTVKIGFQYLLQIIKLLQTILLL